MLCNAAELAGFLSRLGLALLALLPGVVGVGDPLGSDLIVSRFEVIIDPPSEGRPILELEFGGRGNAPIVPMLIVLRTFFSPADVVGLVVVDEIVGTAGVELVCSVGTGIVFDGVLSLDGVREDDAARFEVEIECKLFLVLTTGKAGKAAVGGSYGGREDLGRVAAMVKEFFRDQEGCFLTTSSRESSVVKGDCRR